MNFIPEQPKESNQVPYFEDVTKEAGWQGQTTGKSIQTLQSEITQAINRLGALVISFQRGVFESEVDRDGFRVHYTIAASDGRQVPGRIDIAALPIRYESHREKSLKMALYMFRQSMAGTWFLQQLSPGYSALVPFMLGKGTDKTLSQMWTDSSIMNNLLPPGDEDFVEGEATEIK
jgi:hypothetical protein